MLKRGLTLIEILVSMLLIALVLMGLANVLVAGKRYVALSRSKASSGELGKFFLDPLQDQFIRQDRWGNANNCVTNHGTANCPGAQTVVPTTFTPNWNITDVGGTSLHRVKLDITWPKEILAP